MESLSRVGFEFFYSISFFSIFASVLWGEIQRNVVLLVTVVKSPNLTFKGQEQYFITTMICVAVLFYHICIHSGGGVLFSTLLPLMGFGEPGGGVST